MTARSFVSMVNMDHLSICSFVLVCLFVWVLFCFCFLGFFWLFFFGKLGIIAVMVTIDLYTQVPYSWIQPSFGFTVKRV